jgi:hypothetical protein
MRSKVTRLVLSQIGVQTFLRLRFGEDCMKNTEWGKLSFGSCAWTPGERRRWLWVAAGPRPGPAGRARWKGDWATRSREKKRRGPRPAGPGRERNRGKVGQVGCASGMKLDCSPQPVFEIENILNFQTHFIDYKRVWIQIKFKFRLILIAKQNKIK